MPAMNGTGPQGSGPMTGRGLGLCNKADDTVPSFSSGRKYGLGRGNCGRGFGQRGFCAAPNATLEQQKGMLSRQKTFLESLLTNIDKQIEKL